MQAVGPSTTASTTSSELTSSTLKTKEDPPTSSSLAHAGGDSLKKSGCIGRFAELLLGLLDKLSLKKLADWIRGKLGLLEKQKSDPSSAWTLGTGEPESTEEEPTGAEEPEGSISLTRYPDKLKEKLLAQMASQSGGAEKVDRFIEAFVSYRAAKEKLSHSLPKILTKANHLVQECLDQLNKKQLSLDSLVKRLPAIDSRGGVDREVLAKDLARLLRLSAISAALQPEGAAPDGGTRLLELVKGLKWADDNWADHRHDISACLNEIWKELDQITPRTSAYYKKSLEEMREPLGGEKISKQLFAHMVTQASVLYPQELYQCGGERLRCMVWEILALAEMPDPSGTGWEGTAAAAGNLRDLMLQLKEKNGPYREKKEAIESGGCVDFKKLRHEAKMQSLQQDSKNDLRTLRTRLKNITGDLSADELFRDSKRALHYLATSLRRNHFGSLISTDELKSILMDYFICADQFGHVCRGNQLSNEGWVRLDAKFNRILLSIINLYSRGGGLMGIKPHSTEKWNRLTPAQKEDVIKILEKGEFATWELKSGRISHYMRMNQSKLEELDMQRNPPADKWERTKRLQSDKYLREKWLHLGAELDLFVDMFECLLRSSVSSWWRSAP